MAGMARRAGLNETAVGQEPDEFHLLKEVLEILENSDFKIIAKDISTRRFVGDILASRIELGQERRYTLEVATRLNSSKIRDYQARFRNYVRQANTPFSEFDEYWVITDTFSEETINARLNNDRHFRVLRSERAAEIVSPPSLTSPYRG